MKHCISTYLGGEIIEPSDCDYSSYKELGLKCVFCQSPVFFRCDYEYTRKDRPIKTSACFVHYEAESEEARLCEARSLSKQGKAEIAAKVTRQRNQRLVLYHTKLLDLACHLGECKAVQMNFKELKRKYPEHSLKTMQKVSKHCLSTVKASFAGVTCDDINRPVTPYNQKIVNEILVFLSKRLNLLLLNGLLLLFLWHLNEEKLRAKEIVDFLRYIAREEGSSEDKLKISGFLCHFIASVDWAAAIKAQHPAQAVDDRCHR